MSHDVMPQHDTVLPVDQAECRLAVDADTWLEVIGIDGVMDRVYFIRPQTHDTQAMAYIIRDGEYRGGMVHSPECRARVMLPDVRMHMHHRDSARYTSEQARVTGIPRSVGGVNDLQAMPPDENSCLQQ